MYGPKRKRERLEIEAFLNLQETNFRDLEGRFVILPNGLNRFKHELQRRNMPLSTHLTDAVGFVYIDYDGGLSLFISGAVSPEFNEVFMFEEMNFPIELRLRLNSLINTSILLLSNFWEPESSMIAQKIYQEHYFDAARNKVRELVWLDVLRHPYMPDDLRVLFLDAATNEVVDDESIWVRPVNILSMTEKSLVLEVLILSDSEDLSIKLGKYSVVMISTFSDETPLAVLQSQIQNDAAGLIQPVNVKDFESSRIYKKLRDKAEEHLSKGQLEEAKASLLELISNFEKSFEPDSEETPDLKHFYSALEEVIYHELANDSTHILTIMDDYAWVYHRLAEIHLSLGEIEAAGNYFTKSCLISPVHSDYQLTFAEYYRTIGDWNGYLICTRNALDFALSKRTIAQAYRNFSTFFKMRQEYTNAAAMLYLSLDFDPLENFVKNELAVLFQKAHKHINKPDEESMIKLLEAYEIPYGASEQIMELALNMALYFETTKRPHLAVEMYEILYDLTEDDEIHTRIRVLKKQEEGI